MSTLSELRAELREMVGTGVYDKSFKDSQALDAINFACDDIASKLGLTMVYGASAAVVSKKVEIPSDAISVTSVRK